MITLLVLFIAVLAIMIIAEVFAGIAVVLVPVLFIIGFVLIDYLVFKLLFGRRKKKKEKD